MSAVARLLLERGCCVSGSDVVDLPALEALRRLGASITIGQDPANLSDAALVITSTGVPSDNAEVLAACDQAIPVVHRAQALALLMEDHVGIAVLGTHGKTSTALMIAQILEAAGLDPSYATGERVIGEGANAHAGQGIYFVAEADESDGSFVLLKPELVVLTNVEDDHLEHYDGDVEQLRAAFGQVLTALPTSGTVVVCAEDPVAMRLARHAPCRVVTYGLSAAADVRGEDVRIGGALQGAQSGAGRCVVIAQDVDLGAITLAAPGRHQLLNALGAVAVSTVLDVPFAATQAALAGYRPAVRRFQTRLVQSGVTVVDDYAHHPTEIAATLAASSVCGWQRVISVFQPHRYSRTRMLSDRLGIALADASDIVVVTEIHPGAGEAREEGVSGRMVADAARRHRPDIPVLWVPERQRVAGVVADLVIPGDLVVSLGAGDITDLADELAPLLDTATARRALGGSAC